MLDDSVMFAKRLRHAGQPVTLCVVDDLPHGFLSLSQLSRETREAADICVARICAVFTQDGGTASPTMPASPTTPQSEPRKHRKLERTHGGPTPPTDASATSSTSSGGGGGGGEGSGGGDGGFAEPSLSLGDDGLSVEGEEEELAALSESGAGTVAPVPSQNGAKAPGVRA